MAGVSFCTRDRKTGDVGDTPDLRPAPLELVKAIMLAVAFLFWAANHLWPDIPLATPFNDIAIALFVLDVFLVIIGWPAGIPDESFAETFPNRNEPSAPEAGHRGH